AVGTLLGQRSIPGGELAIGVTVAAEEHLAPLAPPLGQVPHLALGASDADRQRLAVFALGVARARHEPAKATAPDHHRLAALLADFVGGLFGEDFDLAIDLFEVLSVLALDLRVVVAAAG